MITIIKVLKIKSVAPRRATLVRQTSATDCQITVRGDTAIRRDNVISFVKFFNFDLPN